jgi:hypothetical protein
MFIIQPRFSQSACFLWDSESVIVDLWQELFEGKSEKKWDVQI